MNRLLAARCCAALLLPLAVAQEPRPGAGTQNPGVAPRPDVVPTVPLQQLPGLFDTQRVRQSGDPLDPVWVPAPQQRPFEGFPVFPSQLQGYGLGYPRRAADLARGGLLPMPVVPPSEPQTGWPDWVRARSKTPLEYAPDKALLVRNADRVWWRAPDEAAFVPLYFHDKLRIVGAGTEVEVRQTGDFELMLHGGSRFVLQGRAHLRIEALGEASAEVRVQAFTKLRIDARGRLHVVHLPDGSKLTFPAESAEQPVGSSVVLDRAIEPGWFAGRATLWNGGQRAVQWAHAFGTVELGPGERVTLFLAPPAAPVAAGVVPGDATTELAGAALVCTAPQATAVSWSGATFRLPAGAALRLEPMQGAPFAPPPKTPPAAHGR